jgi:hypothetical protein
MPTIPRRWPVEVENEREQALQEAVEATHYLQEAQEKIDSARTKIYNNQSFATILLCDAGRSAADAMTAMERVQRFIAVSRSKSVSGRWPIGASKQREDVHLASDIVIKTLIEAQEKTAQAREKLRLNPGLIEIMLADIAQLQATAMTQTERIQRLLVEAAMGRD